jgi:type IV secretion system protein VirB2
MFSSLRHFFGAHSRQLVVAGVMIAACLVLVTPAHAATGATGTGLPWETPLNTLKTSLTGVVANAIAAIAFFVGGAMLVWGGEMNEFARKAIQIVMGVAFLLMGYTALGIFFPGAVVPSNGLTLTQPSVVLSLPTSER